MVNQVKRIKLFDPLSKKAAVVIEGNGRNDAEQLSDLPDDLVPIIGCTYEIRGLIRDWLKSGRRFIYWDRGYIARGGKAWLHTPQVPGGINYYRWQLSGYQMTRTDMNASPDRWKQLRPNVQPWRKSGKHIVVAVPSEAYASFHEMDGWLDEIVDAAKETRRKIIVRHKSSTTPLQKDVEEAHCLITHGSVAAVEAAIMGCPVFVDSTSAAAPVGKIDRDFNNPIMPDRTQWLYSLANAQYTLRELLSGECWNYVK